MPELRRDPVSGRLVAIAPARAGRPGASSPLADELGTCPFCAGREERTPPETLRLGDPWRVRVVPNLFPALERHEVVIQSPEHLTSLGDLEDGQLDLVAEAWSRRAAAFHAEGYPYVQALLNEGRDAASSLSHTHSQIAGLPETPPVPAAERALGRLLDGETVLERDGLVLFCPYGSRLPYEVCVAPARREAGGFESALLAPALRLLAEAIRRLRAMHPGAPLNAWLHPVDWWHLELVPRLAPFGSLELGAGVWVNAVDPVDAARELRNAGP